MTCVKLDIVKGIELMILLAFVPTVDFSAELLLVVFLLLLVLLGSFVSVDPEVCAVYHCSSK